MEIWELTWTCTGPAAVMVDSTALTPGGLLRVRRSRFHDGIVPRVGASVRIVDDSNEIEGSKPA